MNKSYTQKLTITYAIISIVLFLIMAIADGGMMFSMLIGIASFILLITLPTLFVRNQRKANGGNISFKEAFLTSFLGLTIGGAIYMIFMFVYVNVIDVNYVENMINQQIENTLKFMQGNVPDDEMVKTLTNMENQMRAGFTPVGLIRTFGIYMVVYGLFSLILAAIMKRQPVFVQSSDEIVDN